MITKFSRMGRLPHFLTYGAPRAGGAPLLLLTYKAINGLAPFYLQELIYLKEACKYKLRSDCDGPSELKTVSLSRIACDNLVNNDGATIYNSDEKSDIS